MDRQYWNSVAADYDSQIQDSLGTDRRRAIRKRIRQFGSPRKVACDFGCGVGKYAPFLARCFKTVYAIDYSQKLLDHAARNCEHVANVRFIRSDLSRPNLKIRMRKPHFAVCANVLIAPQRRTRVNILCNIHRCLVRSGHLMLLVPSTESALWANRRLIDWNRREGRRGSDLKEESIPATATNAADLLEGIFCLDGVRTKHFLREEGVIMLRDAGFEPAEPEKIEYAWDTEFVEPPDWLNAPFPWDWLFIAHKA